MATDENNHKNEARDDWTGCTFRVERGPSSEGRAWGMADILTDVRRRVLARAASISPTPRPRHGRDRPPRPAPAQAPAGHAEDSDDDAARAGMDVFVERARIATRAPRLARRAVAASAGRRCRERPGRVRSRLFFPQLLPSTPLRVRTDLP